ncbi:MAG TPA: hypothetical protein VFR86_15595 [Burkholderiaceae bacterium]|nr:hypothetical protein [Burkholderiaceae bacterium]
MTQPKRAKPAGLPLSAGYGNVVHNLAAAGDRQVRIGGRLIDAAKLTPVDAGELRAGTQAGAPPAKTTPAERLWGNPVQPSPVKLDPGKDIAGGEYGSDLLIEARHFAENNGRGGVSFWDNARQIAKMKSLLEKERGKSLSAVELSEELAHHGIRASKALINVWLFAVERLAAFGPATRCFTTRSVQHIYRQQLTELGKLAALSPLGADKYWKEVVPEVLDRCGHDFDETGQEPDPQQVCTNLEIALSASRNRSRHAERLRETAGAERRRALLGVAQGVAFAGNSPRSARSGRPISSHRRGCRSRGVEMTAETPSFPSNGSARRTARYAFEIASKVQG